MIRVVSTDDGTTVELACDLCGSLCDLTALCLAWPATGDRTGGRWLCHKGCADGRVESAFGCKRIVTMIGTAALHNLVEGLQARTQVTRLAGGALRWHR
jgi:hypothetical protein